MPSGDKKKALKNYVTVQERINQFWKDWPEGQIVTSHAGPDDDFTHTRYKAEIYKHRDHTRPDATGWATEWADPDDYINAGSHEENCETSAIGRALANMNYATKDDRVTAEEIAGGEVQRTRVISRAARDDTPPPDPQDTTDTPGKINYNQRRSIVSLWKRRYKDDVNPEESIDAWLLDNDMDRLDALTEEAAGRIITSLQTRE